MKTLGLIGGLSWQSTLEYYRIINSLVQQRLGGNNAAKLILHSVNFAEIERLQNLGDWEELGRILSDIGVQLERDGAACVMICANTMHKAAGRMESRLRVPMLHIVDATAMAIRAQGLKTVGLLGTKFTMSEDFYKERLLRKHGIAAVVPSPSEIETVHQIIHKELMAGVFQAKSKARFLEIIAGLKARGAQGVILGCTEIPLLLAADECGMPGFDSTLLHAHAAVDFALGTPT